MKKVCILTSVRQRDCVRMFHKECVSLASHGFDVSLVIADNKGDARIKDVNIYDVGKEKSRLLRWTRTLYRIGKTAKKLDCDIYQFNDPELLFIGLYLKKAGKKVIWDMHENIPADILQKKYIPFILRIITISIYKQLEKFTTKKIDAIICTRDSIIHRLNGLNCNLVLINNFPLVNYEVKIAARTEKIVCFAGAIVRNYQHKEIIQAIEGIENVKYLLAGPVRADYLNELKAMKGWQKVDYLGVISFDEVKEMYSRSSIGLSIHKYTPNMDWQIGNFALTKIFEVMFWAMPVVCTNYSLWEEEIFSKTKCGITVVPTDVEAIRNAIIYLLDNPLEAKQMGENGRKVVVESFNWISQEEKLLSLYNRVASY
jgi:glycosyltransferase involved in cell wall biosynthesis